MLPVVDGGANSTPLTCARKRVGNKSCFTGPELVPLAPRRDDAGQAAVVGPFYRSIGKVIHLNFLNATVF